MKWDISDYMKKRRQEAGMTQEELGDLLFVTRQQISHWERRKQKPNIEYIKKMAIILNFPDGTTLNFCNTYGERNMKYTEESLRKFKPLMKQFSLQRQCLRI